MKLKTLITQFIFLFTIGLFSNGLNAQYTLNGSASALGGDCYRLTQQGFTFQNGSVWYTDPVDLSQNFEAQFLMNFGTIDLLGADGMVFVFHQQGPNALGDNGFGMGYQGFVPSLGIEFDTFENGNLNDPFYDHIAVHRDGNVNHGFASNLAGPVAADNFDINIEDGEDHIVTVKWIAGPKILQIYFDCELRIGLNYDIVQNIFSGNSIVTWGFTGATGGESNNQTVCLTEDILGLSQDYEICQGESVELAVSGDDAGNFAWSPATGLSSTNTAATTATPTETTTYTVQYTDLCGNLFTETTTIQVNAIPDIDLGPDQGLCDNEVYNIAIPPVPGVDFVWEDGSVNPERELLPGNLYWLEVSNNGCSFRDSIEITALSAPPNDVFQDLSGCDGDILTLEFNEPGISVSWPDNTSSAQFEITQSGNYSIIFTDDNTNCEAENIIDVLINPNPEIDLGPDVQACEGENVELNPGGIAQSYLWSTDQVSQIINVNQSGIYTLTASNGDCSSTDQIEVTINPLPVIDLGPDFDACQGDEVILTPESAGLELEWQGSIISPSYQVNVSERVDVIATDPASGCSTIDDIFIQILPLPILNLPELVNACDGQVVELENFNAADANLWSTGSVESQIEVLTPGIYTLTTTLGICSSEASVEVTFTASPEYDLGDDFDLCDGNSASFEVIDNPIHNYFWNGVQGDNTFSTFESGLLQFKAIDTETGCIGTDEVEIFRTDVPIISMPQYVPICVDSEVILEATVLNADTYYWLDSDNQEAITVAETGSYFILAENQCGQTVEETRTEVVNCFCNSWVPNTFTPDGDGLNDFFLPVLDCDFFDFKFQIFNRWGALVFESESPDNPWLGEYKDGEYYVGQDVYTWTMTYKSIIYEEIKIFNKIGHVLILR